MAAGRNGLTGVSALPTVEVERIKELGLVQLLLLVREEHLVMVNQRKRNLVAQKLVVK